MGAVEADESGESVGAAEGVAGVGVAAVEVVPGREAVGCAGAAVRSQAVAHSSAGSARPSARSLAPGRGSLAVP